MKRDRLATGQVRAVPVCGLVAYTYTVDGLNVAFRNAKARKRIGPLTVAVKFSLNCQSCRFPTALAGSRSGGNSKCELMNKKG